jgi:26S proteasome regulatory subunit N8
VTSSFAVPFEKDAKDPRIWFVDHDNHQTMFDMFRKVNPKKRVVGWYSTGPNIRPCDLEIHELY